MTRAIIFDFFGVLVTEGFRQFRETHFSGNKQKEQEAIDLINQVDSGLISTHKFMDQLASLANLTHQQIDNELGQNKPNRPLLDYISQELHGKYKLSILSNSSENYPERLLQPIDLELFADILLSYRYKMIKPQPEIYQLAAERLGVKTAEVVFIDDSPGHCEGAESVGMKAIRYTEFGKFKSELESLLSTSSNN